MQILTDQEFLYRNSPADDGIGTITKIKGNSVVFNQLVDSGTTSLTLTSSHKYYTNISGTKSIVNGTGQTISVVGTDNVIDLTRMFGSGNEPTLETFETYFPLDYYDYTQGTLLPFNATGLKSENQYQSESDTLALPISTYFPTGMKSVGDVYDELTPSKAYTRIGSVDLGARNWTYNSSGNRFISERISDAKIPVNDGTIANIKCAMLETKSLYGVLGQNTDMAIAFGSNGVISVRYKSTTDATTFKNAVSGKYLYYELLTPSEVDISPSLDLTYTTYRNGTEQILPVNTSVPTIAPIICDIEYRGYVSVTTSTNPSGVGSVWQSADIITEGGSVSVRARDEAGYRFSRWSNGDTTNPTTISNIQSDITITAYYTLLTNDSINHQFRAYIKDKMAINTLPKAFIDVESFVIRRDLLTSTKSEINAYEMPTNINEGDIIVVYDSKGHVLYHGVIDQISDTKLNCNQIQNFYEGTWVCDNYPTTSIEAEISYLLGQYASGNQKGSTWQDTLIYQELAPIKITTGSTTTGQLETFEANATMDFEEFIYSLYSKYNLIFDFTIPYNSWNIGDNDGKVEIRKPAQTTILIGDNTDVIQSISPTTEIEQTNKLIVYANDGTYRTTYVYKTGSGIVVEPSTQIGRLAKVNTAVVFSDDSLDDIKEANITAEMFNHQISFNIEAKNNLYNFWSWDLGQPIKIWQGNNYFDSVFTGYEISCGNGQEIGLIKVICGKVRTKLTSLLKMGVAR